MKTPTHDHVATMEQIQQAFRMFAMLAVTVDDDDVRASADVVSLADSVGAIVDPTRYHAALASGSLKRQREVIELFTTTKARLRILFPMGWPE